MSDQRSNLADAPDPVCAAPHKFGSFRAAEMSSPRSHSRSAGVKIATPKILMERPLIGSSLSYIGSGNERLNIVHNVQALWSPSSPALSCRLLFRLKTMGCLQESATPTSVSHPCPIKTLGAWCDTGEGLRRPSRSVRQDGGYKQTQFREYRR